MKLGLSKYVKRGIFKVTPGTFDDICDDIGFNKSTFHYFLNELKDNMVFILSKKEIRRGIETSLYYIDLKNLKIYLANHSEEFNIVYEFMKLNFVGSPIPDLENIDNYKKEVI